MPSDLEELGDYGFARQMPTIEECKEFKRLVDVGRAAAGLEPIEFLAFNAAIPCSNTNCLSATNLFSPARMSVGSLTVRAVKKELEAFRTPPFVSSSQQALVDAIGATDKRTGEWYLPEAIRRVTDPFDSMLDDLRERLIEAEVVDPVEALSPPSDPDEWLDDE
jgi:hypothetical protein